MTDEKPEDPQEEKTEEEYRIAEEQMREYLKNMIFEAEQSEEVAEPIFLIGSDTDGKIDFEVNIKSDPHFAAHTLKFLKENMSELIVNYLTAQFLNSKGDPEIKTYIQEFAAAWKERESTEPVVRASQVI